MIPMISMHVGTAVCSCSCSWLATKSYTFFPALFRTNSVSATFLYLTIYFSDKFETNFCIWMVLVHRVTGCRFVQYVDSYTSRSETWMPFNNSKSSTLPIISVSRLTGTDRNGPKWTYENIETDFYGYQNGLQWVPKWTGTDFSSDRNELQWEPEKVGWGTIGTILIKLCMYW